MFSFKLKITILIITSITLLAIFNSSLLIPTYKNLPSNKAIKNKTIINKPNSETTTVVLPTETESDILVKEMNNFSPESDTRLDKILNDCSKIDKEKQYLIIDSTLKKLTEHFQASKKLKDKLNTIIITGNVDDTNRAALFNYVKEKPTDKIAYKLALSECAKNSDLPQCNDKLFAIAHFTDKNNAALLLDIASILSKQGNEEAAQSATEKAAKGHYFSNYHHEYTQRTLELILDNSTLDFNQSLIIATGLSSALPYGISSFIKFCKNNGESNYVLSDACGKVGKLMEKQSDTIISQAVGLTVQEVYFKQTNNQKAVEQIQNRTKAFNKKYRDALVFKGSELMNFDEKLARLWLELGINYGEEVAFDSVVNEVNILLRNPDYNPCSKQDLTTQYQHTNF